MNVDQNFRDVIKTQIKLERNTVKRIRELEDMVNNLAAKLFLAEMRFDTEKHANLLAEVLNLSEIKDKQVTSKFWEVETSEYVDAIVSKRIFEDHVRTETEMLKKINKIREMSDDEALKTVFKHILDDEKKHHTILKEILEKAFKIISVP